MERHQQGPAPKRNLDRFIYYFSGLAIGCVLFGGITQMRACAARSGAAEEWEWKVVPTPGEVSVPQTKP